MYRISRVPRAGLHKDSEWSLMHAHVEKQAVMHLKPHRLGYAYRAVCESHGFDVTIPLWMGETHLIESPAAHFMARVDAVEHEAEHH